MRQMRKIVETRSILGTIIRQWMIVTAERICTEITRKTCLVLWSDEFESEGKRLKVEVTRDKNALCTHNIPAVWTEWNALVADNVAQAADAPIRLLQRSVFAGMRVLGLGATAGLCHAFLVLTCINCFFSMSSLSAFRLVGWSLASVFSTNTAISETRAPSN